jgi:hypothetical protein
MDEANYAYLAGMMDGDGSIALYKRKDYRTQTGFSFTPKMRISAVSKLHLEKLQEIFGGSIDNGYKNHLSKNLVYNLGWSSNQIRDLLPKIEPYLILKKKEANLLLEGLKITEEHRMKRYQVNTPKLMEIVEEMKNLKEGR